MADFGLENRHGVVDDGQGVAEAGMRLVDGSTVPKPLAVNFAS